VVRFADNEGVRSPLLPSVFRDGREGVPAAHRAAAWAPPAEQRQTTLLDLLLKPNDKKVLDFVKASSVSEGTFANMGSTLQLYLDFCEERDLPPALICPPSRELIFSFLAVADGGRVSCKWSKSRVTHLKAWCALHNQSWTAGSLDDFEARQVFSGLKNIEPKTIRESRRPFLVGDQLAVEKHLDPSVGFDAAVIACMRIARAGCLRLIEAVVDSHPSFDPDIHVKLENVSALMDDQLGAFLKIHLPFDKTNRFKGRDVLIPEEHPSIDPVSFLLHVHLRVNKVAVGEHLFTYIDRHGERRRLTRKAFVNTLNEALVKEGLAKIHGHSLRAGGATQLLLWGVAPEIVMLRGGWKTTESFMRYWRKLDDILRIHSRVQLAVAPPRNKNAITTPAPQILTASTQCSLTDLVAVRPAEPLVGPPLSTTTCAAFPDVVTAEQAVTLDESGQVPLRKRSRAEPGTTVSLPRESRQVARSFGNDHVDRGQTSAQSGHVRRDELQRGGRLRRHLRASRCQAERSKANAASLVSYQATC
jgi:hypothetical protein